MSAEQLSNNAQTTLAAAITTTTSPTTISVANGGTPFPSAAQFRILIDNELMLVTGGAGTNTWTVTRGVEGTNATTHCSGALVTGVLTAGALASYFNTLTTEPLNLSGCPQLVLTGTCSPSSPPAGAVWQNGGNGHLNTSDGTNTGAVPLIYAVAYGSESGLTNAIPGDQNADPYSQIVTEYDGQSWLPTNPSGPGNSSKITLTFNCNTEIGSTGYYTTGPTGPGFVLPLRKLVDFTAGQPIAGTITATYTGGTSTYGSVTVTAKSQLFGNYYTALAVVGIGGGVLTSEKGQFLFGSGGGLPDDEVQINVSAESVSGPGTLIVEFTWKISGTQPQPKSPVGGMQQVMTFAGNF